jgi:hypothetical protein
MHCVAVSMEMTEKMAFADRGMGAAVGKKIHSLNRATVTLSPSLVMVILSPSPDTVVGIQCPNLVTADRYRKQRGADLLVVKRILRR